MRIRGIVFCFLLPWGAFCGVRPTHPDLEYAEVNGHALKLDLFLPATGSTPPLVMYFHGGGWLAGSYKSFAGSSLANFLLTNGYAAASVQYRFSSESVFPAQVQDCKGAIRWLRAHAKQYGYDGTRMVTMGHSAGGYLAMFMGVTGDDPHVEGSVGGNTNQSSKVCGVVDYFGPADFLLRSRTQPEQTEKAAGKVYRLLGGAVRAHEKLAQLASPAWQVTPDDPPVIMFHGTADRIVLPDQAQRFFDACREKGVPVELNWVKGAGHGDGPPRAKATPGRVLPERFYSQENLRRLLLFLDERTGKRNQAMPVGK